MTNTCYTLDKTRRLSFRLNDKLADWIENKAKKAGVTPCEFARSLLFSAMVTEQSAASILQEIDAVAGDAKHANKSKR